MDAEERIWGLDYDTIVMQGVLEHIERPYEFLEMLLKRKVRHKGCVITSSPGFLNPRGIVWMTIQMLFDIKMSMFDKHEIWPWDMDVFCNENGYRLKHKTSNLNWGNNVGMIRDFRKRFKSPTFLPLVEEATGIKWDDEKIDKFLYCLDHIRRFIEYDETFNGANFIYKISKG